MTPWLWRWEITLLHLRHCKSLLYNGEWGKQWCELLCIRLSQFKRGNKFPTTATLFIKDFLSLPFFIFIVLLLAYESVGIATPIFRAENEFHGKRSFRQGINFWLWRKLFYDKIQTHHKINFLRDFFLDLQIGRRIIDNANTRRTLREEGTKCREGQENSGEKIRTSRWQDNQSCQRVERWKTDESVPQRKPSELVCCFYCLQFILKMTIKQLDTLVKNNNWYTKHYKQDYFVLYRGIGSRKFLILRRG